MLKIYTISYILILNMKPNEEWLIDIYEVLQIS